ncbi:Mdm33 family-domain-containing protein [Panaeolus papilionaceus]|nr:Mdm33 family-domain-containing protein [Panaeolus papilionaceus]
MLRTSLSRPGLLRGRHFSTTHPAHSSPSNSGNTKQTTPKHDLEEINSRVVVEPQATTSTSTPSEPTPSERPTQLDLEIVKYRIQEWTEKATICLRNKADDFTANTKTTFSQLGQHLNKVTGYEEIEALKKGERINLARQAARQAKTAHEEAVLQRANSQREVNDLLQRKSTWSDSDVGRFTKLVRQDHLYEQEEQRAKQAVDDTEAAVDREFSLLMRTILARYHEEQVWSDKIRSASTYGSLAALALNMLVFIMAIIVVEPWKRRRLAQTFEAKLQELSAENQTRLDTSMQSINSIISGQEELIRTFRNDVLDKLVSLDEKAENIVEPPTLPTTPTAPSHTLASWGQLSKHQWEVAVIGGGAFLAGILTSIVFSR